MTNPYLNLDENCFWRSGVVSVDPSDLQGLYTKKWPIKPKMRIAAAGSCFAQHISRHLRDNRYRVVDTEPAPNKLPIADHQRFGYSIYSARFGNIYTTRQLLQLAQEVEGTFEPQDFVWERDGSFYDALRPGVEPDGLSSADEVRVHRRHHLTKVRKMFEAMDLFIFTLGLTETWRHKSSGTVYPMAPGTVAGAYDPGTYEFFNLGFTDILSDLKAFDRVLRRLRGEKARVRYILTVSPVPLVATASGRHVLAATAYSKALLRSAAGHLAEDKYRFDYFPAYEIITNQRAGGSFYADNLRSVTPEGVAAVMKVFFGEHRLPEDVAAKRGKKPQARFTQRNNDYLDAQCEEALLEAFGT